MNLLVIYLSYGRLFYCSSIRSIKIHEAIIIRFFVFFFAVASHIAKPRINIQGSSINNSIAELLDAK